MKQNFSYILCAVFMLFGTSQIIHGAAILGKVGVESLESAFGKVSKELGEGAAKLSLDSVKNISVKLDAELDAKMTTLGIKLEGASVEAAAAVRSAMREDMLRSIITQDAKSIEAATLDRTLSDAGSKAATSAEDTLEGLDPKAPNFPKDFQDVLDIKATLKFSKVSKNVTKALAFPKAAVDSKALRGASPIAGTVIKESPSFIVSRLKKLGSELTAPVRMVGRLGKSVFQMDRTALKEITEVVPKGGKLFKDFDAALKPKIEIGDEGLITEDTIYGADRKPIKNPQGLIDAGFVGKYKKLGDPVFETDASGKIILKKTSKMGYQPVQKTEVRPVLDSSGNPVKSTMADMFGQDPILKKIGTFVAYCLKAIYSGAHMIAVQGMIMGMAMSVPNSLMAGFTAERQQQAQLATLGAPISFGGMVMQIPDELINIGVPSSSLKIYVGIPAANSSAQTIYGGGVNATAANPVVGPDANNPISQVIANLAKDAFKAFMTTLMSASNQMEGAGDSSNIARYTFFEGDSQNASYYDQAHLFCSYSSQSWNPWASAAITDPNFQGLMIDLNTGYVFAEDATTEGNDPALLFGTGPNNAISVGTFLTHYATTLTASGKTYDYTQYTSGGQPDIATKPGDAILRQFGSVCLAPVGGSVSGFGDSCMIGNQRHSLLATSLLKLAAGVCIDQSGHELSLAQLAAINAPVTTSILTPTQEAAAVAGANATANATANAARIASFYTDLNQQTNFAMQSFYASDQASTAKDIYDGLTSDQQSNFALAQAAAAQQQAFIDAVYNGLTADQQNTFTNQLTAFQDNASILAFVNAKATQAQKKTFMDAVFNSLSSAQIIAFIKTYQTALQAFVKKIFNAASQSDKDAFAKSSFASDAQQQAQAQTAKAQALSISSGADANAILKTAIAKGALGGVVPIYGFDNNFQNWIKTNFSKAAANQVSTAGGSAAVVIAGQTTASLISNIASGVTKTSKAGDKVSADDKTGELNLDFSSHVGASSIQGAPNLNYPAFGVYIYECENTPFATELIRLTNTQGLDYIVFFDVYLNSVPLQTLVPDANNFNFPKYELNPAIAYWASLICYIGNGSGPLDEFMARYQDASGVWQTAFPLYLLNGGMAIVPGTTDAMQKVLAALQSPPVGSPANLNTPLLSQQITKVAALEVATYQYGPFYKPYNLKEADQSMWMSQASTTGGGTIYVVPYIGISPYPMTLNLGSTSGPTDYLIPFVKEGGQSITVQLPNPYIDMVVSLVTDIVFVVEVDEATGAATFVPTSYKYSAYNPTTGLDTTKISTFVWLNNFKNAGVTIPEALKTDVEAQRESWVEFIQSNKNDPTFMAQTHGFAFGQRYKVNIVNADDYANKNYMYNCLPSPSGIADDVYVMSASAALPNATVGLIANTAKLQPYIVSMATGFMYDNNGNVAKNSAGRPVDMDTAALLALVKKNQGGKGPSAATLAHLQQINQEGKQFLQAVQGPYEFGDLLLHLYKIDIANANYVYFSLDSSGNPSDYFVVVQSTKSPFVFGGSITGATQNMVSLITGQLYTRTGTAGTWPNLSTLLSAVESSMSISATDLVQIQTLNADFIAQQKAEAFEKSNIADQIAKEKSLVLEDYGNIAANVISKPYLPAPFDSLVKDTSGKYYRITPDANGAPYMIFDFNATTDAKDANVGVMFMADGTFVTTMDGIHLAIMRQQFGVHVASNGGQKLSVPHIAGNMNLSAADQKIVPGISGTALIVSTDAQFPTPGIQKIVSGTKTYYFYYHTFLVSYFAYVVDSASKEQYYISMNDGSTFNSDGSARLLHYQVARDNKGNPMVVAQDTNNMVSATFADPESKTGTYIDFVSDPSQFLCLEETYLSKKSMYGINFSYGTAGSNTALYIYQDMPAQPGNMTFNPNAQTYLVYKSTGALSAAFILDPNSQVQVLTYLPVDPKTGQIITAPVTDLMKSADFIMQQGLIAEVIFNGIRYKASSAGTFAPVSGAGVSISVQVVPAISISTTEPSCASYAVISQGAQEYTYSYAYETLSADEFTNCKQKVWLMDASINPTAKAVLCKQITPNALKAVTIANVKNVPASLKAGVTVAIKNIKFDQASGKYFAPILTADYDYFQQDGYVDIENGGFYDTTGIPYGYSLVLPDYVALLNKLNVMVMYNINTKVYDLVFRSAQAISK